MKEEQKQPTFFLVKKGEVLKQVVLIGQGNYKTRDVIPLIFTDMSSAQEVARAIKAEIFDNHSDALLAAKSWVPAEEPVENDPKVAEVFDAEIKEFVLKPPKTPTKRTKKTQKSIPKDTA